MPYIDIQHLQAIESNLEAVGADSISKLLAGSVKLHDDPQLILAAVRITDAKLEINRGRSENPGHTWMTPDPINDPSPASSKELDLDTEAMLLSQLIIDDGLNMNENPAINPQLTMMENQGNGINVLNNGGANAMLQTFTPGHFLHAGNIDKVPGFSSYVHSAMLNTVSTTQHAPAQLPTAMQVQPQPGIMQYAPVSATDYVPTKHAERMYEHTDRFLDILENYSRKPRFGGKRKHRGSGYRYEPVQHNYGYGAPPPRYNPYPRYEEYRHRDNSHQYRGQSRSPGPYRG
ncbi:hypothetical protein K439DRAFT_1623936 [Ramaria rubella]|nr:hypothetical protein K439DRAFT_1623936 [Ramaria rubella]